MRVRPGVRASDIDGNETHEYHIKESTDETNNDHRGKAVMHTERVF